MLATSTPFDRFVRDVSVWMSDMWLMWAGLAIEVAMIVVIIVAAKAMARAYDRVPHYRRREN